MSAKINPDVRTSAHHADEHMHCPSCKMPWPCRIFLAARRAKAHGVILTRAEAK